MTEIAADEVDQSELNVASAAATGAQGSTDTDEKYGPIRVVTSRVQLTLLVAIPVLTALALVVFARDPMFATGLIAVISVFVVFQIFASRIPEAFERLQSRRVIVDAEVDAYRLFNQETERNLNSWLGAIATGVALSGLAFARFPAQAGGLDRLWNSVTASLANGRPLLLLDLLAELALGFTLGFIAWRMIVVAVRIMQLGQKFNLKLQVGHPDNCAGFRPLGDLCLWNALILSVPAIFLGLWIPLAPRFGYGNVYTDLHVVLLGILVVLAVVTFIAPMWSVHLEMAKDAARIRKEVDEIGRKIDGLSRDLVKNADTLSAERITEMTTALEAEQDVYRRSDRLPTWPVDLRIALKFGSAQIVPLLALTGISDPILNAVGPLLDVFGGQ